MVLKAFQQGRTVNKRNGNGKATDEELIVLALQGHQHALEELIYRHRGWIFSKALSMTRDRQAAEDATQEVVLVILTKLSTFRRESSFRYWVHRIISNHVINLKKKKAKEVCFSGSPNERYEDQPFHISLCDYNSLPVDLPLLIEEVGSFCMMGMFLCLDHEQRLIFILGEIFGANDGMGSKVFGISKVNFRKKLSRARKLIYGFVRDKYTTEEKRASWYVRLNSNHGTQGAARPSNGTRHAGRNRNGNRMLFEKKYHQFRRLIHDPPSPETTGDVDRYRNILNSKELQEIIGSRE
jgi:RNA polymerase sigma factor (sigma-70 family)